MNRIVLLALVLAAVVGLDSCALDEASETSARSLDGDDDGQIVSSNDDDENTPDDGIDLGDDLGWPIDAQLLDDGSLVVLYTSSAYEKDPNESSSLAWFDRDLRPVRQIKPEMGFPHTMDYDGKDLLISDSENSRLLLVSKDGSTVRSVEFEEWESGAVWPNDADFTMDGNILFSDLLYNRIYKIAPSGELIWARDAVMDRGRSPGASDELHDPDELADGHLIYCLSKSGQVVEVDENDEVVWRYDTDLNWPKSVQRLSSGTTLITDLDHIIEVAPDGQIVWNNSLGGMNTIRYDDGNTLNGTWHVRMIAPDGTVLWELAPQFQDPKSGRPSENDHRKLLLRSLGYLN